MSPSRNMDAERNNFSFEDLFTFEMANNHQGSLAHGMRIIEETATVAREEGVRAAMKIQLRDLDSFIHPAFRDRKDVKHIPRFLSARLSKEEFQTLVEATRAAGLITMATPFDERSVDTLQELGIEIVKVASCSAQDWPLLERVARAGKPVIVSVGGLDIKEVDKVVSFFEHRGTHFALMHCVAIYPTPSEKLFLKQIEVFRNRYPQLTVGFSTHEPPENTGVIGLAYAKGARFFEKHVGVPTDEIKLNAYSANPDQLRAWLRAWKEARNACGDTLAARPSDPTEVADLQSLKRCVYAKRAIKAGEPIASEDVFFAMPLVSSEHLESGKWREGIVADRDYKSGEALAAALGVRAPSKKDIVYAAVREAKAMLTLAKVPLSHDFTVEISHHYGLDRFTDVGCIIIDCINREYARKLIVQFPGQWHPVHYHKIKDESFHVLSGSMEVDIEGKKKLMYPGDTIWVPRGVWHGFRTDTGVIFEEISTTAHDASGDSYYVDKVIMEKSRDARKTRLLNWGRHQFDE